jgi:hypothetical protein
MAALNASEGDSWDAVSWVQLGEADEKTQMAKTMSAHTLGIRWCEGPFIARVSSWDRTTALSLIRSLLAIRDNALILERETQQADGS